VRIGVDLGGTKIEAVALEDDDSELGRLRRPTPRDGYERIVTAVSKIVAEVETSFGEAAGIGVGTPGAIDPTTGLLKNSNSVSLNGRPLQADIEAALGRGVRLANDADCFALSEASDGAGSGATTVFGVILGTGVGGGVVVGGALLEGPNAIAGEWGHNPIPWPEADERPGPACYCGLSGCVETFLSGPGLERDHASRVGGTSSAGEIAAAADSGDPEALVTLDTYVGRLGRALAVVINVLDPEVVVLGGGVSNIGRLFEDVPAAWGPYVFSSHVLTRLEPAGHGDSSGVRGAARLWPS
jgi:fructokinase